MAGTSEGSRKAAQTNLERYGPDFYGKIGSKGGRKTKADGVIKGFGKRPEIASAAGRKGGLKSKRRKNGQA